MFVSKKRYQQLETLNAYWRARAEEAETVSADLRAKLGRYTKGLSMGTAASAEKRRAKTVVTSDGVPWTANN